MGGREERVEWSNTTVVTNTQSCIHSCLCDVRTGSEVGERGARSQVFAETGLEHTLVFYAWRIVLRERGGVGGGRGCIALQAVITSPS